MKTQSCTKATHAQSFVICKRVCEKELDVLHSALAYEMCEHYIKVFGFH